VNVKRFTARTSRDALILVRQALGEDAVVLSTKPSAQGIEVLAMAPEGMRQVDRIGAAEPPNPYGADSPMAVNARKAAAAAAAKLGRREPDLEPETEDTFPEPTPADADATACR
jgi:flagellar biosynthesis protein FlhF